MNNGDRIQDTVQGEVQAHAEAILKPPQPIVIVELLVALAAGAGVFFPVMFGSTAVVGGWDGALGAVGAMGVMFALLWLTERLDKRTFQVVVTIDGVVVEDWRRRKAQFTHHDWVEGSLSLRRFVQSAFGPAFMWNAGARHPPLLHFKHPPVSQTFVSRLWYGRPSDSWPVLDDVVTALAALPEATRRQVTLSSLLVVARALLDDDESAFDRSRPFSAQHVHEVEAWAMVDADKQPGASGPTWIFEVKAGRCVGVWIERMRAAPTDDMFDAPRHRLDGSEVYAVPTQLDKPERGRAHLLLRLEQLQVLRRAELACSP
jgi:hypothetical protein